MEDSLTLGSTGVSHSQKFLSANTRISKEGIRGQHTTLTFPFAFLAHKLQRIASSTIRIASAAETPRDIPAIQSSFDVKFVIRRTRKTDGFGLTNQFH